MIKGKIEVICDDCGEDETITYNSNSVDKVDLKLLMSVQAGEIYGRCKKCRGFRCVYFVQQELVL